MNNSTNFEKNDYRAMEVLKVCGVQKVNLKGKEFVCPACKCDKLFVSMVHLKIHFLTEHNKKPYICKESNCNWAFPTLSKLGRHQLSHQGDKPFKCNENGCRKVFSNNWNLKAHIKNFHETPPMFLCTFENCNGAFYSQKSLDNHSSEHATSSPSFRCREEGCDSTFYSMSALHFHANRHKYKDDELCCKECGKKFTSPRRLQTHMMSHSMDKPFPCAVPGCNWSFNIRSKFNRHMDSHRSSRNFKCTFQDCGKTFLRKEHLKDHEVVHTRPRKETKVKPVSTALANKQLDGDSEKVLAEPGPKLTGQCIGQSGSARTSITYTDIVVEKGTRSGVTERADSATFTRPISSACDNVSSVLENLPTFDILSPAVSFCDSGQFAVQDDLLSQVLHLDSHATLSGMEPSTVNLRDLE